MSHLRERATKPGTEAATPLSVLVADDEQSLRLLVSATIASDRYTVLEASNGDEAWALAQRHRPALALLDVRMPGLSGVEVARRIKASHDLAGTTVIMLSSKAQPEEIQFALSAGADRYLTKPFSPLELLTTVEQALGIS